MNIIRTISAYFCTASIILALLASGWILPMTGVISVSASAQNKRTDRAPVSEPAEASNRAYFEENKGQFDKRVKYFARGTNGYSLFLTGTEAVYVLQENRIPVKNNPVAINDRANQRPVLSAPQKEQRATAVFMKLSGANENVASNGLEELAHKTNYFKGAEADWRTDIPNFSRVQMNDVYQGVDTIWQGKANGGVQYDFVVAPNADATQIAWQVEGAESVEIDEAGSLLINTEFGTIKQQKPFSYQETNGAKQEIESRFVIDSADQLEVRFEVGAYDRTKTLTIDPSVNLSNLSFSTFLGGGVDDEGNAVAVDRTGSVYVAGQTTSSSFPTTAGTFDTTFNNKSDAFVTKLNAAGTDLIYSTFIGGNQNDYAEDIALDEMGNVFITGSAEDAVNAYPTTDGAYDTTHNGQSDVFISKINAAGSGLIYSTFIGGISGDAGYGIAIDTSGNAYITGTTSDDTTDYPTTVGAFDTTHNGMLDVFVTKINTAGTALIYSTFLGGNENDVGHSIALDSAGNAFITGFTVDGTTDYPNTFGAFDTTHNGLSDTFVTKINLAGSALLYSTFLGGSQGETGNDIVVDAYGNAFITGLTIDGNTEFPTTVGAFNTTHNGATDAFVTKLHFTGSFLLYSTFLGGISNDEGNSIAIDTYGNAFITGVTFASDPAYPTTAGAFDTTHNGGSDAMATKLNAAGTAIDYSTYIGGNSGEMAKGIALDASGNAFITGRTSGGQMCIRRRLRPLIRLRMVPRTRLSANWVISQYPVKRSTIPASHW